MSSLFSLKDKNVLITGAAGLLGVEHASAILEIGGSVILTDIDEERLSKVQSELSKEYNNSIIETFVMDVTSEQSIQNVLNICIERFQKIDVLINNAAIDPKVKENNSLEESRLENFSLESWNFQISVGLTGAMLCSKYFGSHMADLGGGVILNIASDLSIIAPNQEIYKKNSRDEQSQPVKPVTYSVIKHGLHGLTKYLSTYWKKSIVRSNSLSPGGVYNNQPDDFMEKLTPLIPMKRMAHKSEYRGCIQFLCSDASSYMNGHNLVVDGGRSVW